jgi:hypothetical protein
MQMNILRRLTFGAATLIAAGVSVLPASAFVVDWTNWSAGVQNPTLGSAMGSAGSVGVTYTGEMENLFLTSAASQAAGHGPWSFTPTSTWSFSSLGEVGSAPPDSGGIIRIVGGTGATDTITFSKPVVDPVIAIWSLGQGGNTPSFDFTTLPFSVVAGGPSVNYNGLPIFQSGNSVLGTEGNGTVQFVGTFSSISWTNPTNEDWYGFTVGVGAVPEASTWLMLILGFAGIGFVGFQHANGRGSVASV